METTKWFRDRTIVSSILKALAGIITSIAMLIAGDISIVDFLPGLVTMIWGIVDIVNRFKTATAIKGSRLYYKLQR